MKITLTIYKPLKIAYIKDEISTTFNNEEIVYSSKNTKYYLSDNITINSPKIATWNIVKLKHKEKLISKTHASQFQNVFLQTVIYRDYICTYYKLKHKFNMYDEINDINNIKYTKEKHNPLEIICNYSFSSNEFCKNYFHHPNKEHITTNIFKLEKYLRTYYIGKSFEEREKTIKEILSIKKRIDYSIGKSVGLITVSWKEE